MSKEKGGRNSSTQTQTRMHEGEIVIDSVLVRQLLNEQFPALAHKPLELLRTSGTVNAIFRLGNDLVVRLPHLQKWEQSLLDEWIWLPKLAPHLPFALPVPVALGKPSENYTCHWAIYRWIDSQPYEDSLIDDEPQAAADLAAFIQALRSVNSTGAPPGGRSPIPELDEDTRGAIWAARHILNYDEVSLAWERALKAPLWEGTPVWIHGDLLKSNLLVKNGRIHAVIDFGSIGIGDPAADIVPAWSVFNALGRQVFRKALNVDDATWQRARAYALHQALLIIPYYPDTNPDFVSMAKRTVAEVLKDLREHQ